MAKVGIIQIADSRIEATPEDVRMLKSILDKLRIQHIIDDVVFFAAFDAAARMKEIHNVKVWKVEKDGSVSLKNRFGHSGRFEYRKLVMASVYEISYRDLIDLDYEEAEFLSDLVCSVTNDKQSCLT